MKVSIINGSAAYVALFIRLGFTPGSLFEEAKPDVVVFTGGADVSPVLYKDKMHRATHTSPFRDSEEQKVFEFCLKNDIPMVGICRGAQFLNVMSGGRMYQDVTEHAVFSGHEITDLQTGETIHVSSTHHQMMLPSDEGIMVAVSDFPSHREWFEGEIAKRDTSNVGNEVVFYPKTKALCFQPHPEFSGEEWGNMHRYFGDLLERFVIKETA